jgi:hypothetical protein
VILATNLCLFLSVLHDMDRNTFNFYLLFVMMLVPNSFIPSSAIIRGIILVRLNYSPNYKYVVQFHLHCILLRVTNSVHHFLCSPPPLLPTDYLSIRIRVGFKSSQVNAGNWLSTGYVSSARRHTSSVGWHPLHKENFSAANTCRAPFQQDHFDRS